MKIAYRTTLREMPSILAGLLAAYLATRIEAGPWTGEQYAAIVLILAVLAHLIGCALPRRAVHP